MGFVSLENPLLEQLHFFPLLFVGHPIRVSLQVNFFLFGCMAKSLLGAPASHMGVPALLLVQNPADILPGTWQVIAQILESLPSIDMNSRILAWSDSAFC